MKRRILITGASGGLGQALSLAFSREPVFLGLHCFNNKNALERLSKKIHHAPCEPKILTADLRQPTQVMQLFETIEKEWGGIDVLINNAASNQNRLFHKLSDDEWQSQVQINLSGAFFCLREAGKQMKNRQGGHIINIASLAAFTGRTGQSAYTSSKRGLIALSQSAAKEWGPLGIQVNTVCPGFLPTPMTASLSKTQKETLIAENALGRPSTLEEVSAFIHKLSKMRHVSGQTFNLDSRIT